MQSSGGAHTSSTPSSSDTTTSAGATPTQTGVPAGVATAAPAEPPAAALPTEQPTAALPTEQPAAPAPSAEPVPSPGAREAATPETPVATAAAPKTDAPHHESHTAPNSAGSDPMNHAGSASSTSANRQSTVVVQAAATPASTAQPRTATEAAVESMVSTFSAVEGALETEAVPLETRAVPKAFSAPVAPPDVVSGVVSNALASVGLSPVVSNNPLAPVDSPAELAVLAWARRENQQTQSSFGRLFAVKVSSEEPARAPLNPQALSQDPNVGYYQGISMAYRPIDGTNVDVRHPSENAAGTGEAQTVIADEVGRAETNNVVVGHGGPITITTGGTYTGSYQSNNASVPAVTISTTQPVTLSRMHIIAKGIGVWAYDTKGTRLTIVDSVFEQINPGAVVNHRAVEVNQPASFVFEHNQLTDTDGVEIHGLTSLQVNPLRVNYNLAINIGRYPHPTDGNCCVQLLQLDNVITPAGEAQWNHTQNLPGQSGVEDNISFYVSGGTDSAHRIDVGHNLIDGAYSRDLSITNFTGGGINLGDGGGGSGIGGGGWNYAHDNVVVSTTNYGISVNGPNNYATNNVLINDGAEQDSSFGQAIVAWPEVSPAGLHSTGSNYNWRRSTTDATKYPCYVNTYCSGTQVSTTEQQARDAWEAARAAAGVTIGPRP